MKKKFVNNSLNIKNKNYYFLSGKTYFLSKRQIEYCINTIRFFIRKFKKEKKFINMLEFNIPITKKAKFSRMGSGKGIIKKYVSKVKLNSIIFIFRNLDKNIILKIFKYVNYKLPMKIYLKTKINIKKNI